MSQKKYDVAVIGAGVVGCAVARRLTLGGASVVIIEKSLDVLDGASKGNSAILHTGFDAPSSSLELDCVRAGYKEYLELAKKLSLPILESGALVLAWNDEELRQLPKLIKKAHANGVLDVKALSREEILRREPALSSKLLGGFEVPGEYIIDPWASAHAYITQAVENGAILKREVEVLDGKYNSKFWTLKTSSETICAHRVINCAGLYGDILDQRLLKQSRFSIAPRKGQFVVFDKAASSLVSSTILPVPTEITKGVVVCRTIYGNLLVGPTAEDQESRTDSSTDSLALKNLCEKGVELIPSLLSMDITSTYAGLRPATEFSDYQINNEPEIGYVTVGGIRSTGLSAALGIAKYVSKLISDEKVEFSPIRKPKKPSVDRLSEYHQRDWQIEGDNEIICHCELVTKREVEQIMSSSVPPKTLQGLKRRTRVGMGRCQGFYCLANVQKIING